MTEKTCIGGGVNTHGGRLVDVINPTAADIDLDDIIWSLSRQPRYLGHTAENAAGHCYTVGQHCVLLAFAVLKDTKDPQLALAALLHDSPEAYLGDIIRPFKHLMHEYAELEDRMERAICDAFDITPGLIRLMKPWDTRITADEMLALLPLATPPEGVVPLGLEITIWKPSETRAAFKEAFFDLSARARLAA